MKCLLKYKWVKLPRDYPYMGKGIMAHWVKLASRAAFRKGNATYCGHSNPVQPGMWSGGIVGVKSILGLQSRVKALDTLKLPTTCPCCGGPLVIRKFDHFCEKTRMNITGLSEKTLVQMVGHGWLKSFAALYELERYHDELVQTDGFGERSFQRMQNSIEKSRHCTLAQFIAGMGTPFLLTHIPDVR